MGAILNLFLQLLQVFCGGKNNNQQQQHQGQQQGYPGQGQQQGWGQQNQQQGWGQQQQQPSYPPQQQPQAGGWSSSGDGPGNDQQYQQWRNEARREGDLAHK